MCSGDSPEGHRMLLIIYACCHLLAMTSVCTNPVMYGFLNENFKQVHNWMYKEIIGSLDSGYHPSKLNTSQHSNFNPFCPATYLYIYLQIHVRVRWKNLTFPNYKFGKGQYAFYPVKLSRFAEKNKVCGKYPKFIMGALTIWVGCLPN